MTVHEFGFEHLLSFFRVGHDIFDFLLGNLPLDDGGLPSDGVFDPIGELFLVLLEFAD